MPMLTKPAFGPRTALAYVTGGTLLCVWTLVWYFTRENELSRSAWFWVAGLFLTGSTFVFLGLVLGPLGRAARQAELPPEEAVNKEAAIQQSAAANGVPPVPVVNGVNPAQYGQAVPVAPAPPAVPAPVR